MSLREDANAIIHNALREVMPDTAVQKALKSWEFSSGKIILIAIGKAAWQMANAANKSLGSRIDSGIVITKYQHAKSPIRKLKIMEAGHPIPDHNSFLATEEALRLVSNLNENDTVVFLVSGGGSALFEKPLIPEKDLRNLTGHLLACGASITEINTIRKRMSAVKGGKFALACAPAHVLSIVLSDIIGDPLDMIASGPAYPDSSTADDAREVLRKYPYPLSSRMQELISEETPKVLSNVTTFINGSVRELCHSACMTCKDLGYEPIMLTDRLCCEASEAGSFFSSIALSHQQSDHSIAFIAGGETVVHLKGSGSGGRNQEMALSASLQLQHCVDTCFFSIGSDGTDGPTDAAGGYADEHTIQPISSGNPSALTEQNALAYLANNDAYHALQKTGGLIITGPTGTNVNDLSVLLIQR